MDLEGKELSHKMPNLIDLVGSFDNSESPRQSLYSIEKLRDKIKSTNKVVFFTGAGFSKAWSESYPAGFELFSIADVSDRNYNFFYFAKEMGILFPEREDFDDDYAFSKACYEFFKSIKFHLDIYNRYPSLMASFLDRTTIFALEREIIDFIKARFSSFVGESELTPDRPADSELSAQAKNLIEFFNSFISEDKEVSFVTTNYDFVIEKILDSKNRDDICLNRGLINLIDFSAKRWTKNRVSLFKINGGFEIDGCNDSININYSFANSKSNIILPSQEQNYDSKYFKSVFLKSASKLRDANLLVFIGYSLPTEDHTIRFLLKNFIDSRHTDKEIIVVGRSASSAKRIRDNVALLYPQLESEEAIFALDGSFNELVKEKI